MNVRRERGGRVRRRRIHAATLLADDARVFVRLAFHPRRNVMRAAIFPGAKPEQHQPHIMLARLLDDGVNHRRVELARFRLKLFPIDRDFERVGVKIFDGRPDFGQHRRPCTGIVALCAEDEERRTVHNQGMVSVFSHELRKRIVVGLRLRGSQAQPQQEYDCFPHTSSFHFFLCTLAATFNRNAFSRMKPVASSWL